MVDAFQTGIKGFRLVMNGPQLLDRLIAKIHGCSQRGKIPHVHAVHVANQQGGGHGYGADELNQRGQQALPPDRADGCLDVTADSVPEQPYLLLFQFKGPDIPLGRKILLERGGKVPWLDCTTRARASIFLPMYRMGITQTPTRSIFASRIRNCSLTEAL